jgi:carbonic anhydrase
MSHGFRTIGLALIMAGSTLAVAGSNGPKQEARPEKPEHASAAAHEPWSYEGENGPESWSKEFPDCGRPGQSPINIEGTKKLASPELTFDLKPAPLAILNNGHTVQVSFKDGASTLTVGAQQYKLAQFHFHHPSEEAIHGKHTDMVAHLVFQRGEGVNLRLAVVAILLKSGKSNTAIDGLWKHIPETVGHDATLVPDAEINAADLLPGNHDYYTYLGSLTTPPCTEIVTWYVLKTPVELSLAQIETFNKLYPNNARPVQPLNGRVIGEQ